MLPSSPTSLELIRIKPYIQNISDLLLSWTPPPPLPSEETDSDYDQTYSEEYWLTRALAAEIGIPHPISSMLDPKQFQASRSVEELVPYSDNLLSLGSRRYAELYWIWHWVIQRDRSLESTSENDSFARGVGCNSEIDIISSSAKQRKTVGAPQIWFMLAIKARARQIENGSTQRHKGSQWSGSTS